MTRRRLAMPTAIWSQLGPVPVRVIVPCVHPDGEEVAGFCDTANRVLYVDGALSLEAQIQTAFHEAGHLWLHDANVLLKPKLEEDVVTIYGNAIFNVLYGARPRTARPSAPPSAATRASGAASDARSAASASDTANSS